MIGFVSVFTLLASTCLMVCNHNHVQHGWLHNTSKTDVCTGMRQYVQYVQYSSNCRRTLVGLVSGKIVASHGMVLPLDYAATVTCVQIGDVEAIQVTSAWAASNNDIEDIYNRQVLYALAKSSCE